MPLCRPPDSRARHLRPGSSVGDVELCTNTATCAETVADLKVTCGLSDPAPLLGKTACFGLQTHICAARSKEYTAWGELHFIPAINLRAEE